MEKEPFPYTIKSTSTAIAITNYRWSSSNDESSRCEQPMDEPRDNIFLESTPEIGETTQGYENFPRDVEAEPVIKGMELDEREVSILCDFIDNAEGISFDDQIAVNDILEKVCNGGAALDNNEPRYKKDLALRESNTRRQDREEKISMAEIWELIRCQEGYREYSQINLDQGIQKVSRGDCGKIEFILEKEREAANYLEKKKFSDKLRNMEDKINQLQLELNEAKKDRVASISSEHSINSNKDTHRSVLDTLSDSFQSIWSFGDNKPKNTEEKKETCVIQ